MAPNKCTTLKPPKPTEITNTTLDTVLALEPNKMTTAKIADTIAVAAYVTHFVRTC